MVVYEIKVRELLRQLKDNFFKRLRAGVEWLFKRGYMDRVRYSLVLSEIRRSELRVERICAKYLARRRLRSVGRSDVEAEFSAV